MKKEKALSEKLEKDFMECECESCHSIWEFEEENVAMIKGNLVQCPLCWRKNEKT